MNKMANRSNKLYIIRKYVFARSARHAIAQESKVPVDDCWLDEDYKRQSLAANAEIGFTDRKI